MGISFGGGRKFLVLLCSVVLGLVVLVFLPWDLPNKQFSSKVINFERINYPSLVWKDRMLNNLKEAEEENDEAKKFNVYNRIFDDLSLIYIKDHSPKTREQLQNLANFIASEFPSFFRRGGFTVNCLDTECAIATYPPEIESIKSGLSENSVIESLVLESVLKKFEAAALSSDINFQWQNYQGAFEELKAEKTRTNDNRISKGVLELREFLKAKYPEIFNKREKSFPSLFSI